MGLLASDIPVCRYDEISTVSDDTLAFPEVLEKEKKLCRNLLICDYRSAKAHGRTSSGRFFCAGAPFQKLVPAGCSSLMNASFMNLPPEPEDRTHDAFNVSELYHLPDLNSILQRIGDALSALAEQPSEKKSPLDDTA